MISKDKDDKLIRIYFYICDKFEELQYSCERFSNNNKPEFTDQEIMTVYLYTMHHEGHMKAKHIHRFASEYLMSWFPKLGSYQAFNNRLNKLGGAFTRLVEIMLADFQPEDCCLDQSLLDSMPIITCSGKCSGKVAREITDKGFCSTKGIYYYGLKLHLLGFWRIGKLPLTLPFNSLSFLMRSLTLLMHSLTLPFYSLSFLMRSLKLLTDSLWLLGFSLLFLLIISCGKVFPVVVIANAVKQSVWF